MIEPATGQAIVDHGLYWWHRSALKAIAEMGPLYPAAVASAIKGTPTFDAERYLTQLESAGMVELVEVPPCPVMRDPAYSIDPGWWADQQWWGLTPMGEDWATD